MAQGQAMSLLERVHRLTRDRRYLDAAIGALAPLERSVSSGGLRRGGLARYDLASSQLAAPSYQAIHLYLLRALAFLEPNRNLTAYADRWDSHLAAQG
jgi:D-glucuronyl C5-epimerase C-terminus